MSASTRIARGVACLGISLALAGLGACSSDHSDAGDGKATTVTLLVHDSFALPDAIKADFEKKTGLTLNIVSGESGQKLVSKLVLTKDAPVADVVYGFTQATSGELAAHDILTDSAPTQIPGGEAYALEDLPGAVPIDRGDVCVNIDTAYFDKNSLARPATLEDLTKPEYRDLTVTPDPAQGETGLAFFYATIAHNPNGWQEYWKSLKDNGLEIVAGWSEAYEQEFSANGGKRPIVVSYATSPAATMNEERTSASTISLPATCFAQTEYAGILKGSPNEEAAAKVIEWLASEQTQAAIPESMYMYPVRKDTPLPAGWAEFAPAPDPSVTKTLPPADIRTHREGWLRELQALLGR